MTSSAPGRQRRKTAQDRRAEIVAAAGALALDEGLESLTLRRVAEALGVVPGLVNHYFPAVDDLVAVAFGTAAAAELDEVMTAVAVGIGPLARMRRLVAELVADDRDAISLLWIDAWHAARRRPVLREEVTRQMLAWRDRIADLARDGGEAGTFRCTDPTATAVRILAVVDGLSVQAVMRSGADHASVRDLLVRTAERELGLDQGELHSG